MEKSRIEWCDSSWNPITGCLHNCSYCYARRIADRFKGCDQDEVGETSDGTLFELDKPMRITNKRGVARNAPYPFGFAPTLHKYRLGDLKRKHFGKTIFVGSTADIFGEWVPDEWIRLVFEACQKSPEHRYLFLTKNPVRYVKLAEAGLLPCDDNFWYGSTVTTPTQPAFYSDLRHTFVSIEPIAEPFGEYCGEDGIPETADWAIFGAETGNRKEKVVPERSWVEGAVKAFHENGKAVFFKNSMIPIWGEDIPQELPWED